MDLQVRGKRSRITKTNIGNPGSSGDLTGFDLNTDKTDLRKRNCYFPLVVLAPLIRLVNSSNSERVYFKIKLKSRWVSKESRFTGLPWWGNLFRKIWFGNGIVSIRLESCLTCKKHLHTYIDIDRFSYNTDLILKKKSVFCNRQIQFIFKFDSFKI